MESLLQTKEKLKKLYGAYDSYILAVLKFLLAFVTFYMINSLGYFEKLDNIAVLLILALVCSFLPVNAVVLFGAVMLAAQLYGLSMTAALVGGGLLLIIILLHFGIAPKAGYALVLTPLALAFHVPCAVPLILGLASSPLAAVGVVFGTILYYAVGAVTKVNIASAAAEVQGAEEAGLALLEEAKAYLDAITKNMEMIVVVITLLAVFLVVCLIRRMAIKYAWSVAIGAGVFTYVAITMIGNMTLDLPVDWLWLILGTAVSAAAAIVLQFFVFSLDYRRVESVQFEDDDYYYYVKAVPKQKTAAARRMEKKLEGRMRDSGQDEEDYIRETSLPSPENHMNDLKDIEKKITSQMDGRSRRRRER